MTLAEQIEALDGPCDLSTLADKIESRMQKARIGNNLGENLYQNPNEVELNIICALEAIAAAIRAIEEG